MAGTFRFTPVIGSDRAINNANIEFGNMYISTDGGKLYFDKSNDERILVANIDASYIHEQTVSSAIWNINHNLNKYPTVTIIDSAGTEVLGDIVYNDANNITLTFSGDFCGTAYLS